MKAVPAIRLSMMTDGAPFVVDDSTAPALIPDQWNVIQGSWVYPVTGEDYTPKQMNYMAFRLYGRAVDPPNARFPNPGGYFDDCQFGTTPNVPLYTITASAGANGAIDPSGAVSVAQGDNKTFNFLGNSGYVPDQVTIDSGTSEAAGASYTFTDVQAAHTIDVTFVASAITYAITSSVVGGHGTISPTPSVNVPINGNQTFTFNASPGYQPDQVTIDGGTPVDAGASYTFTRVVTTHTISVTFKPQVTFTITPSAGAGGSISPSVPVDVVQGANQTFTFTPDPGYIADQVTIDSGTPQTAGASYTFTNVQAAHTIDVTFVQCVNISGTVTDVVTALPAVGVKLNVHVSGGAGTYDYPVTTGVGGTYSVDVIYLQSDYSVDAVVPQTPSVDMLTPLVNRSIIGSAGLEDDQVWNLDIAYEVPVTGISGVVRDSVTNLPIYNAVVQVGGKKGPACLTNAAGEYSDHGYCPRVWLWRSLR